MSVLIDTGAFYALADADDAFHHVAKAYYEANLGRQDFGTPAYILVETWHLINGRLGRREAMRFWAGIRQGIVTLLAVQPHHLDAAWAIAQRYRDQDFSLVDCTTFAVMEDLGIQTAFAFDAHFRIYRYGPRKRGFLQVVPGP